MPRGGCDEWPALYLEVASTLWPWHPSHRRKGQFPVDGRKIGQELFESLAFFEVVDQRLKGHTRSDENWSSFEDLRIAVDWFHDVSSGRGLHHRRLPDRNRPGVHVQIRLQTERQGEHLRQVAEGEAGEDGNPQIGEMVVEDLLDAE